MNRQHRVRSSVLGFLGILTLPLALPAGNLAGSDLSARSGQVSELGTDRIIVKFRGEDARTARPTDEDMRSLRERTGTDMFYQRRNSFGARLIKLRSFQNLGDVRRVVDRIRRIPGVEYAEPDLILQTLSVPDDARFNEQWNLFEAQAGANLPGAWAHTRGEGTVVAVVDTGYLPHADLAGNMLSGYDMIDDSFVAADGDGRDADATDPGDWSAQGECGARMPGLGSSWHGTHVAGTVAAVANNGVGVAGVASAAKILPIRAVGRCGGYTSDITDGIIWAAGGDVAGVPRNTNPAQVINLSLGGNGQCSATFQSAIDTARELGASVVVAAGNMGVNAATALPANCKGVIAVAALNRGGGRAAYSNFGKVIDIAAPGGEVVRSMANGILSTLNEGTESAAADSYEFFQGTSMAAPHVAGVAALLYSLRPNITPDDVESTLKDSARTFSADCRQCGAGMLDAEAAVNQLLDIDTGVIGPQPRRIPRRAR